MINETTINLDEILSSSPSSSQLFNENIFSNICLNCNTCLNKIIPIYNDWIIQLRLRLGIRLIIFSFLLFLLLILWGKLESRLKHYDFYDNNITLIRVITGIIFLCAILSLGIILVGYKIIISGD